MFLENTIRSPHQKGWIEVIAGSMFSGKTEELIRRLKRAKFARQKIEIFKPALDTRYSTKSIISHDTNSIKSIAIKNSADLMAYYYNRQEIEVIGIDEAQFLDDQLPAICNKLANKGIRVIVAGLDMDFKGRPFGPIPNLFSIAEYVTKVHAICVKCGNLANFSYRKSDVNSLVLLGEKEEYEPLCRSCFDKYHNKKK